MHHGDGAVHPAAGVPVLDAAAEMNNCYRSYAQINARQLADLLLAPDQRQ
jgi:hypothetical protein